MDWALRDYKVDGQLGLEPTIDEYLIKLVAVFDEVKRVLKQTGTCWIVIGDTYDSNKSLCMVPERFALAMIDRGWILRNKIIWYKPNCMPSSIKDRFTVDWEYVYFFTRSQRYYFETQYEPLECGLIENALGRIKRCVWKISTQPYSGAHFAVFPPELVTTMVKAGCPSYICSKCRTPRRMIYHEERINTRPGLDVNNGKSGTAEDPNVGLHTSELSKYRQKIIRFPRIGGIKHAAEGQNPTYSGDEWQPVVREESAELTDCNCKAEFTPGVVLDPFAGSGTTGEVALSLARDFIGIELNPAYIKEQVLKRLDKHIYQERLF